MVFEKVKNIIVEQLGLDEGEVKLETSFEDLGVDSLDLFQIIIEIEEAFDIQVEEAEKIKTVQEAVKYVESKIEK
ncbi:acyl carrier protein [Clostridium botulinum]|uniref:acyl carrier protein n=1 Tax=Clostridium TaxID=1485 RepID=UPI0007731766|nr:acyl carrier protein [Clostridium sporogenes]EKO1914239.1 acyl carrier protein [Clostridium botulinum]AUM97380.1 acyl carrier protein [Clostridium sporogenes]EKO2044293.1 acyl carrier protein [Clostridium botulinum]MCW6076223.1 acyl carrier protein [Clostridium sporogenes]MCW6111992.1 acyl carrier protein [Clostridium sporogenes]